MSWNLRNAFLCSPNLCAKKVSHPVHEKKPCAYVDDIYPRFFFSLSFLCSSHLLCLTYWYNFVSSCIIFTSLKISFRSTLKNFLSFFQSLILYPFILYIFITFSSFCPCLSFSHTYSHSLTLLVLSCPAKGGIFRFLYFR